MTPTVNGATAPTSSDSGDKANNVSKRVNKLLDVRIENDKDALTALKDLHGFFSVNSLHSRRSLRSQIEKRSIVINQDFLEEFRKVKERLDLIYQNVNDMNDAVNSMSSQLSATKAQTHQLIEQTSKLQAENDKLAMKEQVAKAFLKTFQLSETEVQILRAGEVSVEFFDVLERVAKIHKDSNTLVTSGGQTLALEIMEQMSIYQETALEKLYRWAQVHCKNIDSPTSNKLFSLAMAKLQDRPTLFKYVVGAYCTHKRSVLVREFLEALTKGVLDRNGVLQQPLEMAADDPHFYVAKMLSFLQAAIESQDMTVLFSECDKIDLVDETKEALSQTSEGVVTPLKTRIERVVDHPDLPLPTLCSIVFLLNQHAELLSQVMGHGGLAGGLIVISSTCSEKLMLKLNTYVKKEVIERISVPPAGLTPSSGIESLLALLRALLSAPPPPSYVDKIVNAIIEPLIQAINVSASRLSTAEMAVYLLNCLHLILNTVTLFEFMDEWLERLQAQCDAQIDTLTSEQASSLVANLNLSPMYTILQENPRREAAIQPTALNTFVSKMERYLVSPELLTLPQVECLASTTHRSQVLIRAQQVIIAIYKQLHEYVHDPKCGYSNPQALLPRDPSQIVAILGGGSSSGVVRD
ncbi:oligomeric golgi complex [Nesidiocoris tenuis]|uniref:Conserved oligomeric Golgi complex subunit 6 n=1 Tax=Nesidiocoris tenuis TaxID=355587 RepID=A0ABN7A5S6_9HEMI|nr:oligomeric golgi complex [Nesidiocoris tenuis]